MACSETKAKYLHLNAFIIVIFENFITNHPVFLSFFVYSLNCFSLICKLYILFWTFSEMCSVPCFRIPSTVIYRNINSYCLPPLQLLLLSMKLSELSLWVIQHLLDIFNSLVTIYVWGLLLFPFMKSTIPTISYVFTFFSDLQIICLDLNHLRFMGSINIGGYLVVTYLERLVLTLRNFFGCFFFWSVNFQSLFCKLYIFFGKILHLKAVLMLEVIQ